MKFFSSAVLLVILVVGSQSAKAQSAPFPPELKGYDFFSDSRLRSLTFYLSTAVDVKKVMGAACEHNCAFNDEWKISFSYVNSNWSMTGADGRKSRPKAEFVGTLAGIGFRSTKPIVLPEGTVFPDGYSCHYGITESGKLHFASHSCMADGSVLILVGIADENVSDGKDLVLKNQIMDISYGPPLKARDIFTLADK
jgi:hypothetical protein